MDNATSDFVSAGTLEELRVRGRLVVHGRHRPILLVHEMDKFSRSTIAVRTWVSRWNVAASRTAS
jgi:hypothetical protein